MASFQNGADGETAVLLIKFRGQSIIDVPYPQGIFRVVLGDVPFIFNADTLLCGGNLSEIIRLQIGVHYIRHSARDEIQAEITHQLVVEEGIHRAFFHERGMRVLQNLF